MKFSNWITLGLASSTMFGMYAGVVGVRALQEQNSGLALMAALAVIGSILLIVRGRQLIKPLDQFISTRLQK